AASELTPVRSQRPKLVKAGKAPRTKTTHDSAMTPTTEAAKTKEPYLKKTSEEGCLKPSSNFSEFNRSDTNYWLQEDPDSGEIAEKPDGANYGLKTKVGRLWLL